eukprot:TRINITY_DN32005_c0_g1_i1.p1 TRINITY_DN32005_c0_g1~~TRINITY_DN32005_c0_g1_i1.p1  ORF type:complete len:838 (+),score=231.99 TRINITY_DN32005_c0_g1_i1:52-2565(+)
MRRRWAAVLSLAAVSATADDIATGCDTDHALKLTPAMHTMKAAPDVGGGRIGNDVTFAAWVRLGAAPLDLSRILECSTGDGVDQVGIGFRNNGTDEWANNITADSVRLEFMVTQTSSAGASQVGTADVDIPPEWHTDEMWHHYAAVYNSTTGLVTFYMDLVEVTSRDGVPTPRNATRKYCYVGRGGNPDGPGLIGYVRDALVYDDALDLPTLTYAASGPLAARKVPNLLRAAACSAECMELNAVGTARNAAYAPTAAAPWVLDGYVTVHRLPDTDTPSPLLYYGGGDGCTGGLRVYAMREPSGVGMGFGVEMVGGSDGAVETETGVEAALDEPVHLRVEVDAVSARIFVSSELKAEAARGWRAVPGSVSVLNSCHSAGGVATDGVLQLLKVGCLPALPPGAVESDAPAIEKKVYPYIAEEGAVAGLMVPLSGEGVVRWQRADVDRNLDPRGSWHTEVVSFNVPEANLTAANLTVIAVVPHTQVILGCSPRGIWRTADGGLSWALVMEVDCVHLAVLDSGLAVFAELHEVWRSEDLGLNWIRAGTSGGLDLGAASLRSLVVVATGLVLALATTAEIWESKDGAATWRYSDAARVIGRAPSCTPVGAFTNTTHGLVVCGTVMAATVDGGRWWKPVIHRMTLPEAEGVHGAPDGGGFLLRSGSLLYRSVDMGRRWAVAVTAGADIVDVVGIREGSWAAVSPGEIHVTEDGGVTYTKAISYVYGLSDRVSAAYAPLCHTRAACAGRGTCMQGLVWPGWPAACECQPPFAGATCRDIIACDEVRALIGQPADCATRTHVPAEEQQTPGTACTWRKLEVRPGIVRWRCAPPHEDPYDPAYIGG